ncbi:MAG: hypothetical protein C5B50_05475 [Verrucomicrobia bacterium]|nr:MAG: hypothetical protein C5B50_05475 [Verrucomicrobiota bacterium]
MNSVTGDVHSVHLQSLQAAADWSGLVRYWIVHRYEPALQSAALLLRKRTEKEGEPWDQMADAFGELGAVGLVSTDKIPLSLRDRCTFSERATIGLLGWLPAIRFAASCETAWEGPPKEQVEMAVQGCGKAFLLAKEIHDKAVAALCATSATVGFGYLGRWEEALKAGSAAVALREELTTVEPSLHATSLAQAFLNLVTPTYKLGKLQDSLFFARRAVQCAKVGCHFRHDRALPLLSLSIHNLGFALKANHRLLSANYCLRKAVALLRTLPDEKGRLASALDGYAAVAESLGRLDEAEASCRELIDLRRRLDRPGCLVECEFLVGALLLMVSIHIKQERFGAALALCEEAAEKFERSRQAENIQHLNTLAFIFHLRGAAQFGLRNLDAAKGNCDRAVKLLEPLASANPASRFELAKVLDSRSIVLRELGDLEPALADVTRATELLTDLPLTLEFEAAARTILCLSSKGVILATLGHWGAARRTFEEATEKLELRASSESAAWTATTKARVLVSLSYVLLKLEDKLSALERAGEALSCLEKRATLGLPENAELRSLALMNRGNSLLAVADLDGALASYREALSIHKVAFKKNRDAHRGFIARLLLNIGLVSLEKQNRAEAIRYFRRAAMLYRWDARRQPGAWMAERLQVLSTLGQQLSWSGDPGDSAQTQKAVKILEEGLKVAEELRGHFFDGEQLRRVQLSAREIHEGLILNLVGLGSQLQSDEPLQRAFFVGESSRARNLNGIIAEERLRTDDIPAQIAEEFWTQRRRLREASRAVHSYEAGLGAMSGDSTVQSPRPAFLSIKAVHDKLLAAIQREHPDFCSREVQPKDLARIRSLLPTDIPTAFVQYNFSKPGCVALILTSDGIKDVFLRRSERTRIREIANQWSSLAQNFGNVQEIGARRRETETARSLLADIASTFLWPIMPHLHDRGIRRVVISPSRELHLLPLHACPLEDGGHLLDYCEVAYTPSFSVLFHCAQSQQDRSKKLLLATDPTADLRFSEVEALCIEKMYSEKKVLMFRRVTKENLCQLAPACDVLHYSGHVRFVPGDPMSSALVLEGRNDSFSKRWLMLRDVLLDLRLRPNALVIVNGCESGLLRPDETDDYVNFPTGFLVAGASCVLSTLWPVPDFSCALLMRQFHKEWAESKQSVCSAMNKAQRWLRDEIKTGIQLRDEVLPSILLDLPHKHLQDVCAEAADHYAKAFRRIPPFESPLHWASFQPIGLAFPIPHNKN